jgi:hypothetical protein
VCAVADKAASDKSVAGADGPTDGNKPSPITCGRASLRVGPPSTRRQQFDRKGERANRHRIQLTLSSSLACLAGLSNPAAALSPRTVQHGTNYGVVLKGLVSFRLKEFLYVPLCFIFRHVRRFARPAPVGTHIHDSLHLCLTSNVPLLFSRRRSTGRA